MFEDCIRCCEAPAVDELGYCGHCHWAVRAEIEQGFYHLREYLSSWARFTDWCDAHGLEPSSGNDALPLEERGRAPRVVEA